MDILEDNIYEIITLDKSQQNIQNINSVIDKINKKEKSHFFDLYYNSNRNEDDPKLNFYASRTNFRGLYFYKGEKESIKNSDTCMLFNQFIMFDIEGNVNKIGTFSNVLNDGFFLCDINIVVNGKKFVRVGGEIKKEKKWSNMQHLITYSFCNPNNAHKEKTTKIFRKIHNSLWKATLIEKYGHFYLFGGCIFNNEIMFGVVDDRSHYGLNINDN